MLTKEHYRNKAADIQLEPLVSIQSKRKFDPTSSAVTERDIVFLPSPTSATLHEAARDGKYELVKNILEVSPARSRRGINRKDQSDYTPLHYAVRYHHLAIVKLLVEFGADVNMPGPDGASPLHLAARYSSASSCTIKKLSSPILSDPGLPKRKELMGGFLSHLKGEKSSLFSRRDAHRAVHLAAGSIDNNLRPILLPQPCTLLTRTGQHPQEPAKMLSHASGLRATMLLSSSAPDLTKTACADSDAAGRIQLGGDLPDYDAVSLRVVPASGPLRPDDVKCALLVDHAEGRGDLKDSPGKTSCPALHDPVGVSEKEVIDQSQQKPVFHVTVADGNHSEYDVPRKVTSTTSSFSDVERRPDVYQKLEVGATPNDSIVLYLLSQRALVNNRDAQQATPLHYAAAWGKVSAIQELLTDKFIDIEAKDLTWVTALHHAAEHGHAEAVRTLIHHGASLRCLDRENQTPLHIAAAEGHLEVIKVLLEEAVKRNLLSLMILDKSAEDQTAVHLAIENGHVAIASLLIRQGADINCSRRDNATTPLHLSATAGYLDIVKLLVEYGAHIEARNLLNETPLHRAALFNRHDVVAYLLVRGAKIDCLDKDLETPLMVAVRKDNMETVELLLRESADVNLKDANEQSCLHTAAAHDSLKSLDVILRQAPKLVSDIDVHLNTPLHYACMKGYIIVVKKLIAAGAQIGAKNDEDMTPLHLASLHNRIRIVELLLQECPQIVNDEAEARNTAIHLASLKGNTKVIQLLINHGASVDSRNIDQMTALDCAAWKGCVKAVTLLLDSDAQIEPTDKIKRSPLQLACKGGHPEVVKQLLSRGADITRKDNSGRNCLDIAIDENQREVAMTIISQANWQVALRNCTVEGNKVTTPLRKLIKKMPEVAEKVFNQSMTGNGLSQYNPKYEVTCNYEFLEDIYTDWGRDLHLNLKKPITHPIPPHMEDKCRTIPFFSRKKSPKKLHPLMLMVKRERTKLLSHPLVTYLLRRKWRSCARYIFYSKLTVFIVYLFFLTGFAIHTATVPFSCESSHHSYPYNGSCHRCPLLREQIAFPSTPFWVDFGRWPILLLAMGGLLYELLMVLTNVASLFQIQNAIELGAYLTTTLYVLESFEISGRQLEFVQHSFCRDWHRSFGALSLMLSWMSLVLFMRKFPKLGIYVVMFTDIFSTFSQFAPVYFMLMMAFAFAYHLLLLQQTPISYKTATRSIMKTFMSMIGEVEYDTVYNGNEETPALTWFIHFCFIICNCMILMNLLIGLAVDDIQGVQSKAVLKRLAMQVDLALDLEVALPVRFRNLLVVSEETVFPNEEKGWNIWSFWQFKANPLQTLSGLSQLTPMERMQKQLDDLKENYRLMRTRQKVLQNQNSRFELMLTALVKHHGINVEYEVDDEDTT